MPILKRLMVTRQMLAFQDIIFKLQKFWAHQGCALLQPYDMQMGAGTFHPSTILGALGPDPWSCCYVQPSRRPTDGRYGKNPNRLQHFYQFQVLMKPSPEHAQQMCIDSLRDIGIHSDIHDLRFVEDDWESPTLGASGLGWEVWCDGTEIIQFTYFQQVGGFPCHPVSFELTYGLERIAMIAQEKETVYDLNWNGQEGSKKITYGDVALRAEKEFSTYNFECANTEMLFQHFLDAEHECEKLVEKKLALPAYEQCIKSSHYFNLLDARGVVGVLERASYIGRVRALARQCCEVYLQNLEG